MSEITEIEEFFYFNVAVDLQFLFFKEMEKSTKITLGLVIEKKETNCFNLVDRKNAENKAVDLFREIFNNTEMEKYVEEADKILPSVVAVDFLGSSTHDDFVGDVAKQ